MAEVVVMPRLSDSMEEGEIVAWHKKVGDKVQKGELLAEINSDKATMDFESPRTGVLLHIGVPENGKILVGAPLVVIGEAGEAFQNLLGGGGAAATEAPKIESKAAAPESAPVAEVAPSSETHDSSRIFASPLAKEMAKSAGIPLSSVQGSGDNGRVVRRDVEAAINKPAVAAATTTRPEAKFFEPATAPEPTQTVAPTKVATVTNSTDDYTDLPLSSMRKTIAKRLAESKFSAPHFYLTVEINMDKCIALRKQLNDLAAPTKISFNDLVVRASAAALKKHDVINSSWTGEAIRQNHSVHIGIAVAVPEGLFVPVIRNTDTKNLSQINAEIKDMAARAKEGKLQMSEMQGNTFTISNLGMFDIEEFTAIINLPASCILAVSGIVQKPIVVNNEIVVGNTMKVTLSCDHRVVDGAAGAQFLKTLKQILEEPMRLLV